MTNPRRELRHKEAQKMAEERAKLTDEEQLAKLDARLGEGQGAQKERAILATRIKARLDKKAAETEIESRKAEAKKTKAPTNNKDAKARKTRQHE
jgi:hypothetical protein